MGNQFTKFRASAMDETSIFMEPKHLKLEESLEFLNEDELCEVTPENVRLRKEILNTNEREKQAKRKRHNS